MIPAGEEMLVYWGGEAVMAQLTADFNPSKEKRETSNKQSGDWETSKGSRKSATLSVNLLFDENATFDYKDLYDDYNNNVIKELKLSPEEVGKLEVVGDAWIASPGLSAPDQENIEVNVEFQFTDEVDVVEITA